MRIQLLSSLAVAAVLCAANATGQAGIDPDLAKLQTQGSVIAPVAFPPPNAAAGMVSVDATGSDTFTTPDFHGVANSATVAVIRVTWDLSADFDAFFDFDGGSGFGAGLAPEIGATGGMAAGDVTWSYAGLLAAGHPQVLIADISPPMAPGAMFRFGADTDFFVGDPCPGGNFGAAPAVVTVDFADGSSTTCTFVTTSATSSVADCPHSGGLVLGISGSCPGPATVRVTGATPGGKVVIARAFSPGSFVVPAGFPCAGTVLGLSGSGIAVAASVIADGSGTVSFGATLPAAACGRIFAQAIDLGSCTTSNVVGI